eukprot:1137245-Pelagomonas_calceolata.AAC.2
MMGRIKSNTQSRVKDLRWATASVHQGKSQQSALTPNSQARDHEAAKVPHQSALSSPALDHEAAKVPHQSALSSPALDHEATKAHYQFKQFGPQGSQSVIGAAVRCF